MAGMFELFMDTEARFRFRLAAPDGTVMAVSKAFDTKTAAVAGIAAVREYAGMGHITDLCPRTGDAAPPGTLDIPAAQPHDGRRIPRSDVHAHIPSRRPAYRSKWTRVP